MSYTIDRQWGTARRGLAVLAIALTACGKDAAGPSNTDLAGVWDYVISDATGVGVNGVCSIDSITLTFSRVNGVLAGTVAATGDDNIVCVSGSTTLRTVSGTTTLQGITVDGASVEFRFQSLTSVALSSVTPVISTGSFKGSGDTMSGTATFALRFSTANGAVSRSFTGSWTATRR
jgi:hypothetical protein